MIHALQKLAMRRNQCVYRRQWLGVGQQDKEHAVALLLQ